MMRAWRAKRTMIKKMMSASTRYAERIFLRATASASAIETSVSTYATGIAEEASVIARTLRQYRTPSVKNFAANDSPGRPVALLNKAEDRGSGTKGVPTSTSSFEATIMNSLEVFFL